MLEQLVSLCSIHDPVSFLPFGYGFLAKTIIVKIVKTLLVFLSLLRCSWWFETIVIVVVFDCYVDVLLVLVIWFEQASVRAGSFLNEGRLPFAFCCFWLDVLDFSYRFVHDVFDFENGYVLDFVVLSLFWTGLLSLNSFRNLWPFSTSFLGSTFSLLVLEQVLLLSSQLLVLV